MFDWLLPLLPEETALIVIIFGGGLVCVILAGLGGLEKRDFPIGVKRFLYVIGFLLILLAIISYAAPLIPPPVTPTEETPVSTERSDLPVVFSDSFDDNRNQWDLVYFEEDYARSAFEISGGVFTMQVVHVSDSLVWRDIPDVRIKDFVVEFDATIRNLNLLVPVSIAIGFHHNPEENYNVVTFANESYVSYYVVECPAEQEVCSIPSNPPVYSFTYLLKNDETHRFKLVADGSFYSLYLDGLLLKTFEDNDLRTEGDLRIGVYGYGQVGTAITVDFDNLTVYQIP